MNHQVKISAKHQSKIKNGCRCCYDRFATKIFRVGGILWPKTGANPCHAQLGHSDKGHAIKGLDDCNCWDVDLL